MVASQFVGSGRVQVPVIGQECAKRFEYYGASVNVERRPRDRVSAVLHIIYARRGIGPAGVGV